MVVMKECEKAQVQLVLPCQRVVTSHPSDKHHTVFSQEARSIENNALLQLKKTTAKAVDWIVLPLPPPSKLNPS